MGIREWFKKSPQDPEEGKRSISSTSFLTEIRLGSDKRAEEEKAKEASRLKGLESAESLSAFAPDEEVDTPVEGKIPPEARVETEPNPNKVEEDIANGAVQAIQNSPDLSAQDKADILGNPQLQQNLKTEAKKSTPFGLDYKQAVGSFVFGGGVSAVASKAVAGYLARKFLVAGVVASRAGSIGVGMGIGAAVGGAWAGGKEYFNERARVAEVSSYLKEMADKEPLVRMQEYIKLRNEAAHNPTNLDEQQSLMQKMADIEALSKSEEWKDLKGVDRLQRIADLRSKAEAAGKGTEEFDQTLTEARGLWRELERMYSTEKDKKRIAFAALKGAAIGAIGGAAGAAIGNWAHDWWSAHHAAGDVAKGTAVLAKKVGGGVLKEKATAAAEHLSGSGAESHLVNATEEATGAAAKMAKGAAVEASKEHGDVVLDMHKNVWTTAKTYALAYAKEHGIPANKVNNELINHITRIATDENSVEITGDHASGVVADAHHHIAKGVKDIAMKEGTKLHFGGVKGYLDNMFGHASAAGEVAVPDAPVPSGEAPLPGGGDPTHINFLEHSSLARDLKKGVHFTGKRFNELLVATGILGVELGVVYGIHSLQKRNQKERSAENKVASVSGKKAGLRHQNINYPKALSIPAIVDVSDEQGVEELRKEAEPGAGQFVEVLPKLSDEEIFQENERETLESIKQTGALLDQADLVLEDESLTLAFRVESCQRLCSQITEIFNRTRTKIGDPPESKEVNLWKVGTDVAAKLTAQFDRYNVFTKKLTVAEKKLASEIAPPEPLGADDGSTDDFDDDEPKIEAPKASGKVAKNNEKEVQTARGIFDNQMDELDAAVDRVINDLGTIQSVTRFAGILKDTLPTLQDVCGGNPDLENKLRTHYTKRMQGFVVRLMENDLRQQANYVTSITGVEAGTVLAEDKSGRDQVDSAGEPKADIKEVKGEGIPPGVNKNMWKGWFEKKSGTLYAVFSRDKAGAVGDRLKQFFEDPEGNENIIHEIIDGLYPEKIGKKGKGDEPNDYAASFLDDLVKIAEDPRLVSLIKKQENRVRKSRKLKGQR